MDIDHIRRRYAHHSLARAYADRIETMGRPLDLAVASPVGCEAVEQVIAARAERR
ncbi:hypothetical protein ABIC65_001576 [Sphingomonas trueperi]|uniref:hypothetical protein n=1 Tax=Sphingomonas trueperi TaxID=53317 RepID=UPI003392F16E